MEIHILQTGLTKVEERDFVSFYKSFQIPSTGATSDLRTPGVTLDTSQIFTRSLISRASWYIFLISYVF